MSKRGHYWCALVQFLCASVGYMVEASFLMYWAGAFSVYHSVRYLTWKEEETDASH